MDLRQRLLNQNNEALIAVVAGGGEGVPLGAIDYASNGEPFNSVAAKASIDLMTMDYAFNGEPFVTNGGLT